MKAFYLKSVKVISLILILCFLSPLQAFSDSLPSEDPWVFEPHPFPNLNCTELCDFAIEQRDRTRRACNRSNEKGSDAGCGECLEAFIYYLFCAGERWDPDLHTCRAVEFCYTVNYRQDHNLCIGSECL